MRDCITRPFPQARGGVRLGLDRAALGVALLLLLLEELDALGQRVESGVELLHLAKAARSGAALARSWQRFAR